jgi:hypothetical protein
VNRRQYEGQGICPGFILISFVNMSFYINIHHNKRDIKLKVDLVYQDQRTERYSVTARNKKFVFERSKPVFLHTGEKNSSDEWKLTEGPDHLHSAIKADIIKAIVKVIE